MIMISKKFAQAHSMCNAKIASTIKNYSEWPHVGVLKMIGLGLCVVMRRLKMHKVLTVLCVGESKLLPVLYSSHRCFHMVVCCYNTLHRH